MAFPSATGSKEFDLERAWAHARQYAGMVKANAQNVRALSLAGTLPSANVLALVSFLADAKIEFARVSSVPGLAAYARAQVDDPALDIAAEFTNMVSTLDGTIGWIVTNFPKDAGGFLLAQTILASGRTQDRIFTAAATATLRTQLDALIAAIN
jgi:hypothetical protein